ncbi:MAG: hypothetical protein IIC84_07295, partial [Chloroflexi bacterium]|nr:hypothetical protein [Chloroflexota bacterium]
MVEEIAVTVDRVSRQVALLDQTPIATPTPAATLTPTASPTPGPSLAEIQALIDSSINAAIADIPTSTPFPTLTPGLSLRQVENIVEATVTAAIAEIPTPLPTTTPVPVPTPINLPALIAIVSQVSGPATTVVDGAVTLRVEPGQPLAGRDISFILEDLKPWQRVKIEFVDPRSEPAEWITENEANFAKVDGLPVTERTLFADESGRLEWLRIATQDVEGVWSVRITLDGRTITVNYPITQLQLPLQQFEDIGVQFRRYQGFISNVFYSADVPSSLTVDLQAHLAWLVDELEEILGIRSGQIPDIYLVGSRSALDKVSEAIGVDLGFEAGYFMPGGQHQGIYMRADSLRTEVQRTLTHEYIHLVLDEKAGNTSLPAWLNEGLASYYEYQLGLRSERPDASRLVMHVSTDRAKSAALSGGTLPLNALESRASWNSRSDEDEIQLQYAEAHMAVRFLIDTFGPDVPMGVVEKIVEGLSLPDALLEITGQSYAEFQDGFFEWLKNWEDPQRAEVRAYVNTLNGIMDSQDAISERRAKDLNSQLPLFQRITPRSVLVADAQALLSSMNSTSPPSAMIEVHEDALAYLETFVNWLTLELEYAQTSIDARRVQANDMIPEINARESTLRRSINTAAFIYQL